jgi:hypothetical protein
MGYYSKLKAWKTRENFTTNLHQLLWVEEAENYKQLRSYDLKWYVGLALSLSLSCSCSCSCSQCQLYLYYFFYFY